jgi:hypothetical protein
MSINLSQANNHANQLNEQAAVLRSIQSTLLSYQHSLNSHWKGVEMTPTNRVMDEYRNTLASIAADISSIGNDVVREAEAIRRAELLAQAQAEEQARAQAANNP